MKGWKGVQHRPDLATPDQQAHPWLFQCPQPNCYYAVSGRTEESVREQEAKHKCPYQGGLTKIAGSITVTLVEDMWAKADLAYAAMSEDGITSDEAKRRQGVVRGMCEMIAIFMPPHFRTGNEVGKELLKRAANAAAGERYTSPGIGSRRYEVPGFNTPPPLLKVVEGDRVIQLSTNHAATVQRIDEQGIHLKLDIGGFGIAASTVDLKALPKQSLSAAAMKLTEDEIKAIKFSVESGVFTPEQIATTYKILPSEVKKIAAG